MNDLLDDAHTALAALTSDDLEVLFAVSLSRMAGTPGLLAWLEHAADWEMNRLRGFDFRLAPPEEAIDPTEDAEALATAIALHDQFADDPEEVSQSRRDDYRKEPVSAKAHQL